MKHNFEMKKPSRRTILVHAIALHGESFRWAAVFTKYELLMQISKSTRQALDSYPTRTQLVPDTHSSRTRLALKNIERVQHYLRAVPYIPVNHNPDAIENNKLSIPFNFKVSSKCCVSSVVVQRVHISKVQGQPG